MSDLKKAAQQALEALGFSCPAPHLMSKHDAAVTALRAALAQQEQVIRGLHSITNEDRGVLTLCFADESSAEAFMASCTGDADEALIQRTALAQQEQATVKESLPVGQEEPTVKESLMVPKHIAEQMTTTDLAWLETRRLVRVWKELGQMRWVGADEGWGRAIEAVCARLDKECQDVLAWKEKVDASGETAVQLLRKMQGGQE
jgi:hypothetical protein